MRLSNSLRSLPRPLRIVLARLTILVPQMFGVLLATFLLIRLLPGDPALLMLGNMADPKAIGPAMAVALLTTMYGAIIANVLFMPILSKLEGYTEYEVVYREMVVTGLRNIARGESPRNIQDQMVANLAPKMQEKLEAA